MKLLGRDIRSEELLEKVQARLQARGLWPQPEQPAAESGVEPRVDPRGFNLQALEEHADATRPLPLHTHRGGMGQAVLLAKWAFRKSCQVLINEALARQRLFNGHVRDSYAQLSAEVLRLRARVEELEAAAASRTANQAAPALQDDAGADKPDAPPRKLPSVKSGVTGKKRATRSPKAKPAGR
jgi:hypothetical protein